MIASAIPGLFVGMDALYPFGEPTQQSLGYMARWKLSHNQYGKITEHWATEPADHLCPHTQPPTDPSLGARCYRYRNRHQVWLLRSGNSDTGWKVRSVGIQILSNYTNISLFVVTVLHHAYVIWFNQCSLHSLGDVSTRELTG